MLLLQLHKEERASHVFSKYCSCYPGHCLSVVLSNQNSPLAVREVIFFFSPLFHFWPPTGNCFHCSNGKVSLSAFKKLPKSSRCCQAQNLVTLVHQIKSNSFNNNWECINKAKIEFTHTSHKLEKHYTSLRPKAGKKITWNVLKDKKNLLTWRSLLLEGRLKMEARCWSALGIFIA